VGKDKTKTLGVDNHTYTALMPTTVSSNDQRINRAHQGDAVDQPRRRESHSKRDPTCVQYQTESKQC
jgi:hypothetical protein